LAVLNHDDTWAKTNSGLLGLQKIPAGESSLILIDCMDVGKTDDDCMPCTICQALGWPALAAILATRDGWIPARQIDPQLARRAIAIAARIFGNSFMILNHPRIVFIPRHGSSKAA
jgi:hypothetical protein